MQGIPMDKENQNSTIGELKGKLKLLLDEILPRIERTISRIERSLNNHLRHHVETEKQKSDRWFKVLVIVMQILLSAMVSYLLFGK